MMKPVPLDRLRELAKHRSIRAPLGEPDDPAPAVAVDAEPPLIWPVPRSPVVG